MRFLALVFSGIFLFLPVARAQGPAYLSGMEDMPLMPGLEESLDDGMLFDQPEGRIVLSVARCEGCGSQVAGYYRNLLPALGWQVGDEPGLVFLRSEERLVIEVQAEDDGRDTVSFTLAPGEK